MSGEWCNYAAINHGLGIKMRFESVATPPHINKLKELS